MKIKLKLGDVIISPKLGFYNTPEQTLKEKSDLYNIFEQTLKEKYGLSDEKISKVYEAIRGGKWKIC